jgi:hypothetical protein
MNQDTELPPLVRAIALVIALREIGAAAAATGRSIGYDKLLVAEGLGRIRAVIDDWADRAGATEDVSAAARALRIAAARVSATLRGRSAHCAHMPELDAVEFEARRAAMRYRAAHEGSP